MLEDLQNALLPHFRRLKDEKGAPEERLGSFIRGLFSEFRARPAYAPFIFSEEIFHIEPMLREKLQEVMSENIAVLSESFRTLQLDGTCRGDIEAGELALVTLGSIRLAVSRWHMSGGALKPEALSEKLIRTLNLLFSRPEQNHTFRPEAS
jgi:hypothetical protein